MTTWHRAMQRKDGRWDFVNHTNSRGPWPVGYCAGYHEMTEEQGQRIGLDAEVVAQHNAELRWHREKYHEDGHATAEEAEACNRLYELDHSLRIREDASTQKKCAVCGAWSTLRAEVMQGLHRWPVCAEHQGREDVAKLWEAGHGHE